MTRALPPVPKRRSSKGPGSGPSAASSKPASSAPSAPFAAASDPSSASRPGVPVTYNTTHGDWKKHTKAEGHAKFGRQYLSEFATQLCNYVKAKHNFSVEVVSVIPKDSTRGSGDSMRFSGYLFFSPAALSGWEQPDFSLAPTAVSSLLTQLQDVLQRAFSTRGYEAFSDMPFGVQALNCSLAPVSAPSWYAASVLFGLPPSLTPAADGVAIRELAEETWAILSAHASASDRALLAKYDAPWKRTRVFGLITYTCTVGKKAERLVACAFPKTDEGQAVAAALASAGWDDTEGEPIFFELGGGRTVANVPFPSGGKGSKDHAAFLQNCCGRIKDETAGTYVRRIPSVGAALITDPSLPSRIVSEVTDLQSIHPSCRFGRGYPGGVCIFVKTSEVITSSDEDIAASIHEAAQGAARPSSAQVRNVARYTAEAKAHRPSKAAASGSAKPDATASSSASSKPAASAGPFISASARTKMAKSVGNFRKGIQSGKRGVCASLNAPGGERGIRVGLWADMEHCVKGCPFAVYKNFSSDEKARAWLLEQMQASGQLDDDICPDGVLDETALLRLWGRTPTNATNLTNRFVYVPEARRAAGGGLMWFQDDSPELLAARQRCTPGHPSFLPADQRPPFPAAAADAMADDSSDDEDGPETQESQVSVRPPSHATPKKRARASSPRSDDTSSTASSSTFGSFKPASDTQFVAFSVAPFVIDTEFRAVLSEAYVADPAALGPVKMATKKGEPDRSYMVACFYDVSVGERVIDELSAVEYCGVPMAPRWLSANEWAYFFTIRTKTSAHGRLPQLAQSTIIKRLKEQCPTSHHARLDALLCRTDDTFAVMEEYQTWFGPDGFSPFGNILNSTF